MLIPLCLIENGIVIGGIRGHELDFENFRLGEKLPTAMVACRYCPGFVFRLL
jgi:hypothetical protein